MHQEQQPDGTNKTESSVTTAVDDLQRGAEAKSVLVVPAESRHHPDYQRCQRQHEVTDGVHKATAPDCRIHGVRERGESHPNGCEDQWFYDAELQLIIAIDGSSSGIRNQDGTSHHGRDAARIVRLRLAQIFENQPRDFDSSQAVITFLQGVWQQLRTILEAKNENGITTFSLAWVVRIDGQEQLITMQSGDSRIYAVVKKQSEMAQAEEPQVIKLTTDAAHGGGLLRALMRSGVGAELERGGANSYNTSATMEIVIHEDIDPATLLGVVGVTDGITRDAHRKRSLFPGLVEDTPFNEVVQNSFSGQSGGVAQLPEQLRVQAIQLMQARPEDNQVYDDLTALVMDLRGEEPEGEDFDPHQTTMPTSFSLPTDSLPTEETTRTNPLQSSTAQTVVGSATQAAERSMTAPFQVRIQNLEEQPVMITTDVLIQLARTAGHGASITNEEQQRLRQTTVTINRTHQGQAIRMRNIGRRHVLVHKATSGDFRSVYGSSNAILLEPGDRVFFPNTRLSLDVELSSDRSRVDVYYRRRPARHRN